MAENGPCDNLEIGKIGNNAEAREGQAGGMQLKR